jgi:HPt (histidine-containing phosphotransfer) domain-containing protein
VDREGLQRAAHTLKSSSAMFGAAEVARLAAALEAQAPAGSTEALTNELSRLGAAHDAACLALERLAG